MAKSSTARKLDDAPLVQADRRPAFGGGEPPAPPVRPNTPIASNAWLAVLMFLGAEAMFFAGLIGAFLVFRIASPVWPPPFQPRLPAEHNGNQYADFTRQRRHDPAWIESESTRRSRASGALAVVDRRSGHEFFIDSGIRVVSPDSFWLDRVEQRLRQFVLHDYRLSRVACFRRVNLAGCRVAKGESRQVHAAELRRFTNLRHVLDIRRGFVAHSLWARLSLLSHLIDTPESIR